MRQSDTKRTHNFLRLVSYVGPGQANSCAIYDYRYRILYLCKHQSFKNNRDDVYCGKYNHDESTTTDRLKRKEQKKKKRDRTIINSLITSKTIRETNTAQTPIVTHKDFTRKTNYRFVTFPYNPNVCFENANNLNLFRNYKLIQI